MTFDDLGLSAQILRAVKDQGYTQPTPIQAKAIPTALSGQDLMGGAQTGTGKTAGFTLPLLELLSKRASRKGRRPIRALILTPTRELAAQVADSVRDYGRYTSLRSTVVFGGVKINPQIDRLRRGVDIVVATPGRLLDHANQRTVDLSQIEILVLDEADRMLDMGFIHDIRKIIGMMPPTGERQTLFFSATFNDEIKKLANRLLEKPVLIEVAKRNATAENIKQTIYTVDQKRKREFLSEMIGKNDWRQVLVFTRTKHGANRLSGQLEDDGLSSAAIHGNKTQGARTKALNDFKRGKVRVLVATDIAARGLDIELLPHVVNYELPNVPEDYVHRIGRTGRAGGDGAAISLVCGEEFKMLRDIERMLKREFDKEVIEGYEPTEGPRREASRGRPGGKGRPGGSRNARPSGGRPRREGASHDRPRREGSSEGDHGDRSRRDNAGAARPRREGASTGNNKGYGGRNRNEQSSSDRPRREGAPAGNGKGYGDRNGSNSGNRSSSKPAHRSGSPKRSGGPGKRSAGNGGNNPPRQRSSRSDG